MRAVPILGTIVLILGTVVVAQNPPSEPAATAEARNEQRITVDECRQEATRLFLEAMSDWMQITLEKLNEFEPSVMSTGRLELHLRLPEDPGPDRIVESQEDEISPFDDVFFSGTHTHSPMVRNVGTSEEVPTD